MSGLRKSLLLALLLSLSLFTFSCTLEPLCHDGDTKCETGGIGYRDFQLCINNVWVKQQCVESEICLHGGCVARSKCGENVAQCSSSGEVEICALSGNPMIVSCKDGLICDDDACASGQNCCIEDKTCKETVNSCQDEHILMLCVEGKMPSKLSCGEGEKCEAGACVDDNTINDCDDTYTALCVVNAKQVCENGQVIKVECGAQICKDGVCVDDKISECDEAYAISCDGNVALTCVEHMILRTECGDMDCKDGVCVEDLCRNHRLDAGEKAVDCGGACAPCVDCLTDAQCGIDGFCDSASAYLCSKRCRGDADCANSELWDGEFCRGDGRCSPKVFETIWEVTGDDLGVELPFDLDYPDAQCDCRILWGDEPTGLDVMSIDRTKDCRIRPSHQYLEPGRYNIKIIGTYDGWGAFDEINVDGKDLPTPAASKLLSVVSFGPVGLSRAAFYGVTKLSFMPLKDIPDASKLKTLAHAFRRASDFDLPIDHWDTSNVTDMSGMFRSASVFNQPLGSWDTSNVTDMSEMFFSAQAFNQPLEAWNTSSVTDMSYMFSNARKFDQPLEAWNTSSVTDMSYMFSFATVFNQPLGSWDTSKVTDMSEMFYHASVFNQPLGSWDTSNVTDMSEMFSYASVFNQPLGSWDISKVTNLDSMFMGAIVFNQDLMSWELVNNPSINAIFSGSGMNEANLCPLKSKGMMWFMNWEQIGKDPICN